MPAFKVPTRSASVSDLLYAATGVFRMTLAKTLPAGMFAILLLGLPDFYWLTTGKPLDLLHPPIDDSKFWIFSAVGFAGYQLLAGALMLRQQDILQGRAASWRTDLASAFSRWPILIVSSLLQWMLIFAGVLAFILPGVFAFVCLLVLRPVALFEARDPLQAIGRSFSLARPLWIKVLACAVIAGLIFVICVFAATACLAILQSLLIMAGLQPAAMSAFASACLLGVQAMALVYFNALWLVLYSTANSSA